MMRPTEMRKRSLQARVARVAAALGVMALVCAALGILFLNPILNSFARRKIEEGFAAGHPGAVLHLGPIRYSWRGSRLVVNSIHLTTSDSSFTTGRIAIHHAHWERLLWGKAGLPRAFARARVEATDLMLEFSRPRYELRCARLAASVPAGVLTAQNITLWPEMDDQAFFATQHFRATRFRLTIPTCRLGGIAYADLLQGAAYRAQWLQVSGPELDAFVDREKLAAPRARPPLMVPEALAKLGKPLAIDELVLTHGNIRYAERREAEGPPGVLTFGALEAVAKSLVSPAPPGTVLTIQGAGTLMNAGILKARMWLPLASPDLSLTYSGSLSPTDITRLNAFLENAEHIRIRSGWSDGATFDVQVRAGHATGGVQPIYDDLDIAFRSHQTGSEKGVVKRTESFFANAFELRKNNLPDKEGLVRTGRVDYVRQREDTFLKFLWAALRSGLLDGIHV